MAHNGKQDSYISHSTTTTTLVWPPLGTRNRGGTTVQPHDRQLCHKFVPDILYGAPPTKLCERKAPQVSYIRMADLSSHHGADEPATVSKLSKALPTQAIGSSHPGPVCLLYMGAYLSKIEPEYNPRPPTKPKIDPARPIRLPAVQVSSCYLPVKGATFPDISRLSFQACALRCQSMAGTHTPQRSFHRYSLAVPIRAGQPECLRN